MKRRVKLALACRCMWNVWFGCVLVGTMATLNMCYCWNP